MSLITALAISIGVLGGLATYLFLGPAGALGLQIWAAFIAWGCFYHVGGKEAGLKTVVTQNLLGVVCAWLALLLVTQVPVAASIGLPAWAGICVGVMVLVAVLAASSPMFAVIPATVYGFAACAAYALLATKLDTLLEPSLANPLINVALSMIVGALFGYVSEKAAGALVTAASAQAA